MLGYPQFPARASAAAAVLLILAAAPAAAADLTVDSLLGPQVAEEGLAGIRGGEAETLVNGDLAINDSSQNAAITGNGIYARTISGGIAGNTIAGNRGLTVSNFNSGNFNAFQTTVQYNIRLQ